MSGLRFFSSGQVNVQSELEIDRLSALGERLDRFRRVPGKR